MQALSYPSPLRAKRVVGRAPSASEAGGGHFIWRRTCAATPPLSFASLKPPLPTLRGGRDQIRACSYFFASLAPPALAFASFLHWLMNFLRSLPWIFLSSASLEQASDSGVRGFTAFL